MNSKRLALLALAGSARLLLPAAAGAQAILRFEHGGTKPTTFAYSIPSGSQGRLMDGDALKIDEGGRMCVAVDNANPLLYTYGMKTEDIALQKPAELSDFLDALKQFNTTIGALVVAAETQTPVVDKWAEYTQRLQSAGTKLARIEEQKWATEAGSFVVAWEKVKGLLDSVNADVQAAGALRAANKETFAKQDQYDLIVLAEDYIRSAYDRVKKEWNEAKTRYEALSKGEDCTVGAESDQKVSYSIKAKTELPKGKDRVRYLGDVFTNITVHVVSRRLLATSVGALMGFFTKVDTFTVKDGLVQSGQKSQNPLRPAAFLYGRTSPAWPFWITVGIGTGEKLKYPDVFLGLTARIGGNVKTPLVSIGAGAMWSAFPTLLGNGAEVGHALPATIKNLSDALGYDRRWGLGVHLAIYGFELLPGASGNAKK